MSQIATVSKTSTTNKVVYYHVTVKLPLRSITVLKRYSDFPILITSICKLLGIKELDFPYQLPPKRSLSWFGRSESVIDERKQLLPAFLNAVLNDRELQNLLPVSEFLNLPVNFKFTPSMFTGSNGSSSSFSDSGNNIATLEARASSELDINSWQELARNIKYFVEVLTDSVLSSGAVLVDKTSARDKAIKFLIPSIDSLDKQLNGLGLSNAETRKKRAILKELKDLASLLTQIQSSKSYNNSNNNNNNNISDRGLLFSSTTGGRSLGAANVAVETKDTLPLDNQELLQAQIQIHQKQDLEVENLRKIVQRQREIGEMINQEVAEQNDLIDEFQQDLERTSDKLHQARNRTRKLG